MDDEVEAGKAGVPDRSERGFLHDISSPLAVGQGNLNIIISKLKAVPPAIEGQALLDKLDKVATAFNKIARLLNERRIATRPDTTKE